MTMGAGKALTKLAAIGAAIAGAIFFWRKTHPQEHTTPPAQTFPPAADRPESP
jgi:hypothetical protein